MGCSCRVCNAGMSVALTVTSSGSHRDGGVPSTALLVLLMMTSEKTSLSVRAAAGVAALNRVSSSSYQMRMIHDQSRPQQLDPHDSIDDGTLHACPLDIEPTETILWLGRVTMTWRL